MIHPHSPPGIFADLEHYVPMGNHLRGFKRGFSFVATALLHPGWQAVFILRLAQFFRRWKLYPLSWVLYRCDLHLFAIDIHPATQIGPELWLPHPLGIVIARDSRIGAGVTVFQNVSLAGRGNPITIGDRCVLGAGCCVLAGVTLGEAVTVGANAVVTKSFPAKVTVVGVPARIIKTGLQVESSKPSAT